MMRVLLKDIYFAAKLLKREGIRRFLYRFYWYLKGKRLMEEIEPPKSIPDTAIPQKVSEKRCPSTGVLFISHDADMAGAQLLLLNLIEWFNRYTCWNAKIICLRGGILINRFEKAAPTLIWSDLVKNFPDQQKREKYLADFAGKVDLIYANTVISARIYDVLKVFNAPIITHVHELEKTISTLLKPEDLKKFIELSDAYIACSSAVEENLRNNHLSPEKSLATVNAFIDPAPAEIIERSKEFTREELNLKKDRFTVFGCGTIDWRKGADLFVEAAIELKKRGYSDFQFYWIGKNSWDRSRLNFSNKSWSEMEERIVTNHIEDNIEFLGIKTNPREYFIGGDCFLLSSREDPFPLVALEAAECKLPVICFEDAGGMPGFVKQGAGFTVPFEDVKAVVDKIAYLIENEKERTEIGESARKLVLHQHTVDIAAPQILEFCRKVGNFGPSVSVVVPNYNYEEYLKRRLDSILQQSFKDYELLILDDASTDNSLEIIEEYRHLPNVRIMINDKNSGNAFHQWKKGLEAARGEIIWIAEADDYAEPEFMESLVHEFHDPGLVLAYCDSHVVNEHNEIIRDYQAYHDMLDTRHWKSDYTMWADDEINFGLGVKNSIPNVSAVLMRKSALDLDILEKAREFRLVGDWYVYVSMLQGKKLHYHSGKLNYHRKHDRTQRAESHKTENKRHMLNEIEKVHQWVLDNYKIKPGFSEKWDAYITLQIVSLFPGVKKAEFDDYYPYTKTLNRIRRLESLSGKRTALFVTHAAGRSGAPQIIYHIIEHFSLHDHIDCIILSLQDGPMMADFRKIGLAYVVTNNIVKEHNMPVRDFLQSLDELPAFAMINTACCAYITPEIRACGIPTMTLIHDYTYAFSKRYLEAMYENSDQIIYSTPFMVEKNIHDYSFDLGKTSVIPQGLYKKDFLERDQEALRKEFRKKLNIPEDAFVVLGSGFLHPRKGVDIFIMTALQVLAGAGNKDFRFVWIGGRLESNSPDMYIRFLHRDLVNSGRLDKILFMGQIDDVLPYYALSDLLFLSSREDPFPTIVMESFAVGNPVIGMEGSSGSIELLKQTDNFVAPYGNIGRIAEMILEISRDRELRENAALKGKSLVMKDFDFDHYVIRLKEMLVNELQVNKDMFAQPEVAPPPQRK